MRFLKLTFLILLIVSITGGSLYYFFFLPSEKPIDQLYEVEIPSKRDIQQVISATGGLKLKDQVKIGSLVQGQVKAIYVEENDLVREGQLLVEIETGWGDTEVREAEGAYERGLAEWEYQEALFKRKKKLYEEHFLSEADFQEIKRDYLMALADVKTLKANYERTKIAFDNQKVYAPASGIVIHLEVAKGEKVSSDLDGGELLSFAPDVKQIEANLEISEKDIGQVQKGQKVRMIVETYPHRVFESLLHNISFTGKMNSEEECFYEAKAYIDNPHLLLRPGMSINATIDVAAVDSAWSVTSRPFLIKQEHLTPLSTLLNFSLKPLEESEKEALLASDRKENLQFVWVACEDCFKEIPVEIGITDNIFFEITSGLKGDEKLVVDVMEEDEMQKIYEKVYRKI